ncbi:inositol monophosphatase family protein [Thermofilum pendens]|uniref:D-fructose 1,6-bisphosphatase n=1 Tax=Thermofilum pendens (strain DSM 2475 / Hrk 5) TaxID=368408 RepID=A1RWN0_THEPD|nr:inositol monophosphatase [Thermofilum pendens]ABL77610.1 D-fructose 1,6-bisphosphatase [Thermofilum pendens Hrk 5]
MSREILDVVRQASKVAAEAAIKALEEGVGAREEGRGSGGDISLRGDILAERSAIEYLEKRIGDFSVVSEEIGEKTYGKGGGYRFIIDPIDGSRNYKRGTPFFAVSVAAAEGETLEDVIAGAVYAPLLGMEFYALAGGGAFLNGRRLRVPPGGDTGAVEGKVVAISSTPKAFFLPYVFALNLSLRGAVVRMLGSASLEVSMVASGGVDAYIDAWGTMRVVDVAAATLVAREAGAYVVLGGRLGTPPRISLDERLYILVASSKILAEHVAAIYEESLGHPIEELFRAFGVEG